MKMEEADYRRIKCDIRDFIKLLKVPEVVRQYREQGLSDMRIRWDLYNASRPNYRNNLYDYLTDSHIDTALRQIMRELRIY